MKSEFTTMEFVIVGLATAFGATIFFGAIYFGIGLLTGIYGICAIAPRWWQEIYSNLPGLIPIAGLTAGMATAIWINKKSQEGFK